MPEPEIDIGIITGSAGYCSGQPGEVRFIETQFGDAEIVLNKVGGWRIGVMERHGKGHRHLPNTIPHRANVLALARLGARALLATTVVGLVDRKSNLGTPILFDDLFFPENRLPDGSACTMFVEPGDPLRGHLIPVEPFSPRLRRKLELAARTMGVEVRVGGVYGHANGPRFETRSETNWLSSAGVTAVSQTCGPEAVLAGELDLPYSLIGFPVNFAGEPGEFGDLNRMLNRATEVLPDLVSGALELIEDGDMVSDNSSVYRIEREMG